MKRFQYSSARFLLWVQQVVGLLVIAASFLVWWQTGELGMASAWMDLAGMFLLCTGQVMGAILDTADSTRKCAELLKEARDAQG